MIDLTIDPDRLGNRCGIAIRALHNGKYDAYDFAELDRESVIIWMDNNKDRLSHMILAILGLDP